MSRINNAGIWAVNDFVQEYARNVMLDGWLSAAERAFDNRGGGNAVLEVRAIESKTGTPMTLTLDPAWFIA